MFAWHKRIFFPMDQKHGTFDSPDSIYIPKPLLNDSSKESDHVFDDPPNRAIGGYQDLSPDFSF